MTNYTKSTNFASKDSLAVGNPLKIVKGAEIDAEFNNIATAVNTKADLLSPTFTGVPAAPTASAGTSTTQVATTAFVAAANALQDTAIGLKAPLASPALTGVPTVPTAAVNTNTTQAASTAFVLAQAASAAPLANGTAAVGTATKFAREDHVHAAIGVGIGQTWQDVKASRALATTYTNNTGKPIMVNVFTANTGASSNSTLYVSGVAVSYIGGDSTNGAASATLSAVVPNGADYVVTGSRTLTGGYWAELR
jgi:hypothetical protein